MKKIAIVTAISLASISGAHAAATVYGKAFVGVDYISIDKESGSDTTETKLQSHSSRIGFKGEEELMLGTDVIYQLEYGVKIDDNEQAKQFTSRNTFIGLQNGQYGTLLMGRHDTPFKLSKGSVEQFGDYTETDISKVMRGEERANNVIAYKSPVIVGMPVTFLGAVSLNECVTVDGDCVASDGKKTEKNNAYSAMVNYDQNGIYAGLGYDANVYGTDTNGWRLAGGLDMGKMNMVNGLMLGAMYQSYDLNKTENENAWLISGKYKVGETPWAVKAQYVNTDNYNGVKDDKATEIALGSEYSFNKATKAHMYVAKINKDLVPTAKSPKPDEDKTVVGAGLEYKF